MPFKSEKQRRWMWANEPEMARRWTKKYGNKIEESARKKRKKKHGKSRDKKRTRSRRS